MTDVWRDVVVSGVRFGLTGMQVVDAGHRQPGQVSHHEADGFGDDDRRGANRRGLIDHQQGRAVAGELVDDGPQLRLVLGQSLVSGSFLPWRFRATA